MKKALLLGLLALSIILSGCGGSSGYDDYAYDPGYYDPGYYPPLPNPNPNPNPNPDGPGWTLLAYYDSYEMRAGEELDVDDWDGVLSNDSYLSGETYLEMDTRSVQGGEIEWYSDGSFIYTPPSATFTGRDTFKYTLSDDYGRRSTADVIIYVN